VAMYQRSLSANYNQPQVHSRLAAMRPNWTYRANERAATGAQVTLAPQMAYGTPYGNPYASSPMSMQASSSPMTYAPPMAYGGGAPMTYGSSGVGVTAERLVPYPDPRMSNADPAHVPSTSSGPATAETPHIHAH